MKNSNIQWCDATWNIARGCTKVDEDCKYCYMYRDSMESTRYNPLEVVRTKTVFDFPLKYKETKSKVWNGKPLIFTSSLTDVFHPAIDAYRNEMWEIVRKSPNSIKQILTKRPERILDNLPPFWPDIYQDVWLGTSIGSGKSIQRLFDLIVPIQPGVKFLSIEPLHGDVDLHLDNFVDMGHKVCDLIDWVIVGGESGNGIMSEQKGVKYGYRVCQLKWIESVVDQCKKFNIPVFVKQLGTHLAKEMKLSDRHGGNINEFPEHLKIRQFPI